MMIPRCGPCCGAAFRRKAIVVSEAKDGREIQARRNRQPDLIFGAENGLDLAGAIRKDRSVPRIVPTGKGDLSTGLLTPKWAPTTTLVKSFQL